MSEFLDSYIKKNRPFFKKQLKYLEDNDWTKRENYYKKGDDDDYRYTDYKSLTEEFVLQSKVVDGVLDRVKYLVTKAKNEHKEPKFKRFYKFCIDIVGYHTSRIDEYTLIQI
jgi:hypothetical protein